MTMEMITITPDMKPAVLINLDEADRINHILAKAKDVGEVNESNQQDIETLLMDLHSAAKMLESRRKEAKAPITALGKEIDAAVKTASIPVDDAKRSLQAKISAFIAERQRIEREARERAMREAAAREAEERAKAQAEADELAALIGEDVEPEPVKPDPVMTAKPVETKSAAVVMKKVKRLVITDPSKVPAYIGGEELRTINNAAVRRAIESGLTVPGAEIIEEEQVSMKGNAPW